MKQLGFGNKELKKAVAYLRVSTEEQVENYSLDTQEGICSKEAERRGIELIKVFKEEGRSAKNISGRPVLIEMLEFCRKNKRDIDAIIVYRLDRISRQTADYLAIRKKLAECEITLLSASEPTGNSPTEKFVETMLAGFAQMDNDVKSERSRNGLRARFLSGLMTGPAPLGYINQQGYVTKNPETWNTMKDAWDLMATGTKTLREISAWMNEQKLKAKIRGKEYEICHQLAGRTFRNKFYVGVIQSKKYSHEVQGQQPPMITEEQYYRVQAILDGRNTNIAIPLARRNRDNPDFPLRRIVKCQRCGTIFTGAWSKGQYTRYGYYFCKKRCGGPSVPVKVLEDEMINLLKKISPKPQTIELLIAFIRKTYYQRITTLQKRREEADTQLKKCYELRQALIEKNLAGIYSDDIFKEQNLLVEERIKDIQITKNDAMIDKYNLEAIITFIKQKFENLSQMYIQSDLEQKRVLLCSTMPLGALWSYPGLSNSQLSPYFQAILDIEQGSGSFSAEGQSRTDIACSSDRCLDHLGYLSAICLVVMWAGPPLVGTRSKTILLEFIIQ